jgi:hypothetical protein
LASFNETSLVTLEDLEARSPFPLSSRDREVAKAAIVDASNLVRHEGNPNWNPMNVPPVVKTVVRNSVSRFMNLLDGVTVSRAGDETEHYTDLQEKTGTVFLTEDEKETVRRCAGRGRSSMFAVSTFLYTPPTQPEQSVAPEATVAPTPAPATALASAFFEERL